MALKLEENRRDREREKEEGEESRLSFWPMPAVRYGWHANPIKLVAVFVACYWSDGARA